jgi:hypothetical protein
MVRQEHRLVAQYLDIIISATVHDAALILDQVPIVCSVHLHYLMNGDFPTNKKNCSALHVHQ